MKKWLSFGLAAGAALLLALPSSNTIGADTDSIEHVGAARCKMCHNKADSGKFFDDWEKGPHAKAFDLLKPEEQKDPKCQKCHTTGFEKPGGFASLEKTPKMVGVQCESCHGPGQLHMKSKAGNVIPHAWEPEEETCKKCHNPESPTWKEDRYVDEQGNKSGFNYNMAVKKVGHPEVFKAIGKEQTRGK